LSTKPAKLTGTFVRPLRRLSMRFQNREVHWDDVGAVPTGWGHVKEPSPLERVLHALYDWWRFRTAERPGRTRPEEQYPDGYEVPAVARARREGRS